MDTQRIRMLKTMLEEIQAGTWQPTRPAVFDMHTADWQEEVEGVLHADLVGCALLDPRFAADCFTQNRQGGMEWAYLNAYFGFDTGELEYLIDPTSYDDPTLGAVLQRVSSYCHFWVARLPGKAGPVHVLHGPCNQVLGFQPSLDKAEWIANELNNALAQAAGSGDTKSLDLWGIDHQ